MNAPTTRRLTIAAFLAVAVIGVLLRPLMPVDETRYLAVAWEMWQSGDYLVPTKNFELYPHKPPLLFWLVNLVWGLTGVSEIAARLVGPVSAALAVALTGRLAARLWPEDPWSNARATLALAGTVIFAISGGLTMFDALLALTTVLALLALVHAVDTHARRWWVVAGVAVGLGVLAKGPVILIHTLPAMLAVPFWAGRAKVRLHELGTGICIALLVALALVAMWLLPAILSGGAEYRQEVLWTQSAGRMAGSFAHERGWWWFLTLLPLLLFPWIFVPALWRAAIAADWREPGLRLALVWGGSALLLFSLISGKQLHYLVPELPAVALIVARLTRGLSFRPFLAVVPVVVLALLAIAASAGLIPLGEAGRLLHPKSILLAWGFFAIAVCWIALRSGGLIGGTVLTLGTILSLNLLIGLTDTRAIYDTDRIATILATHEADGVAAYGQTYHAEFNFAGRMTAPVATPDTPAALMRWAADHPKGLIVSRPDRTAPPWQPRETVLFRNATYAIWHAADAPRSLLEPAS